MEIITLTIGYVAAFCSTFGLFPLALRVWRTGEVSQLPVGMVTVMFMGAVLWLVYGIIRADQVIIGANAIGLFFIGYVGMVKLRSLKQ
ncbi:MAG: SemiSWEET family transporter [Candidatus Kapaibacterium sp.]